MNRLLTFLRIIDPYDGNISLSNLAVIVILAKLCITTDTSMVDLGGLFVSLLNYSTKKYINKDINKVSLETQQKEENV